MGDQLGLFGDLEPVRRPLGLAPEAEPLRELAARVPGRIRLGPSSWSFPGWRGIVWDREATETELARDGLAALARHPLVRTVGIDRSYYAPLDAETFRRYADATPADFRFVVKAHQDLTVPGPRFLDAAWALDQVIAPFVEGLGARVGPLVFQFQPGGPALDGGAAKFAEVLHRFLAALPRGPLYAVELRTRALFTPLYARALADAGACHCVNVHPTMPLPAAQARVAGPALARALVVRWNLGGKRGYAEQKARFAPFDRIVEADDPTRDELAELAVPGERPVFVTVNNKAEGCAPLSVERLARALARR